MPQKLSKQVSYIYLALIPLLAAVPAFVIGHTSYKIYLPVWIVNSILMLIAAWILGLHIFKTNDTEKKHLAFISLLLILPWLFISIFFGMGPPPSAPAVWVARATEQQTRYTILIVSGILIALGLSGLRTKLNKAGEDFYSMLGFTAVIIAITLYLMYMTLLHSFDYEANKLYIITTGQMPPLYFAIGKQYLLVSIVESALMYLATALFAYSLQTCGWFGKKAARAYMIISTAALLGVAFYLMFRKQLAFFGIFPLLIPAIPFVMPYLFGVNLLKKVANSNDLPQSA